MPDQAGPTHTPGYQEWLAKEIEQAKSESLIQGQRDYGYTQWLNRELSQAHGPPARPEQYDADLQQMIAQSATPISEGGFGTESKTLGFIENVLRKTTGGLANRALSKYWLEEVEGGTYIDTPSGQGTVGEFVSDLLSFGLDPAIYAGGFAGKVAAHATFLGAPMHGFMKFGERAGRAALEGAGALGGMSAAHSAPTQYLSEGEVSLGRIAADTAFGAATGAALGPAQALGKLSLSIPAEIGILTGSSKVAQEIFAPEEEWHFWDNLLHSTALVGALKLPHAPQLTKQFIEKRRAKQSENVVDPTQSDKDFAELGMPGLTLRKRQQISQSLEDLTKTVEYSFKIFNLPDFNRFVAEHPDAALRIMMRKSHPKAISDNIGPIDTVVADGAQFWPKSMRRRLQMMLELKADEIVQRLENIAKTAGQTAPRRGKDRRSYDDFRARAKEINEEGEKPAHFRDPEPGKPFALFRGLSGDKRFAAQGVDFYSHSPEKAEQYSQRMMDRTAFERSEGEVIRYEKGADPRVEEVRITADRIFDATKPMPDRVRKALKKAGVPEKLIESIEKSDGNFGTLNLQEIQRDKRIFDALRELGYDLAKFSDYTDAGFDFSFVPLKPVQKMRTYNTRLGDVPADSMPSAWSELPMQDKIEHSAFGGTGEAELPERRQVLISRRQFEADAENIVNNEMAMRQRGEPEGAMLKAQFKLGGGVLSHVIEHVGDLTNRMGQKRNQGYDVKNKIRRSLRILTQKYGFEKEHNQNMEANARATGTSLEKYLSEADAALAHYADSHRQLPVFNEAHRLGRNAAIALGEKRFSDAAKLLQKLDDMLPENPRELRDVLTKFDYDVYAADQGGTGTFDQKGFAFTPSTGGATSPGIVRDPVRQEAIREGFHSLSLDPHPKVKTQIRPPQRPKKGPQRPAKPVQEVVQSPDVASSVERLIQTNDAIAEGQVKSDLAQKLKRKNAQKEVAQALYEASDKTWDTPHIQSPEMRAKKGPNDYERIIDMLEAEQRGKAVREDFELMSRDPTVAPATAFPEHYAQNFEILGEPFDKLIFGKQPLDMSRVGDQSKSVSAPQVIDELSRVLYAVGEDVPIRVGRMKTAPNAAGYFTLYTDIIRIRTANDIRVAAHEVGHAFDKLVFQNRSFNPKVWSYPKQALNELIVMGKELYGDKVPTAGYTGEGMAEFVYGYVFEPVKAKEKAPKLYEWFEDTLLANYPKALRAFKRARKNATIWKEQGAASRVAETIVDTGSLKERGKLTLNKLKYEGQKLKDTGGASIAEGLWPIKQMVAKWNFERQAWAQRQGKAFEPLTPDKNPYEFAKTARLLHDSIVEQMVQNGMVNFSSQRVGPSLVEALAPYTNKYKGKQSEIDFISFLYARRAIRLWTQGTRERNPGISLEDAKFVFEEIRQKYPEIEVAAKNWDTWWDGVLNYISETSPTYRRQVNHMRKTDPGAYIPLQREFHFLDNVTAQMNTGSVTSGTIGKRLHGSGRRIKHPIQTSILQAGHFIHAAHQRYLMDMLIKMADPSKGGYFDITDTLKGKIGGKFETEFAPGLGRFIEKIEKGKELQLRRRLENVVENLNQQMPKDNDGNRLAKIKIEDTGIISADSDIILNAMIDFWGVQKKPTQLADYVFPYTDEFGRVDFYQVNKDLWNALQQLDHADLSKLPVVGNIIKYGLVKPKRVFVTGTTGARLSFGLVTNPLRDVQTMMVNSRAQANAGELFWAWTKAVGRVALMTADPTGKYAKTNDVIRLYEELGIKSGQALTQEIHRARAASRNLFKSFGMRVIEPRTWFEGVQRVVQGLEMAPRMAEMELIAKQLGVLDKNGKRRPSGVGLSEEQVRQMRQEGKYVEGDLTLAEATELRLAAKEVTTDFSASNKITRELNQVIPFFNAAFQGPRATIRALRRAPVRTTLRALTNITVPTLALWWAYKDEDWYNEMPWRDRFLFWHVPINDGKDMIRIPRAFEIGAIFGALPEALMDSWYRTDPEAAIEWFKHTYEVMVPQLMPVPIKEAWQQARNKDDFWDRPIDPLAKFITAPPPGERYQTYSSRVSIFLGQMFDVAPTRIDHAIRGIGGGLAADIIEVLGFGPVELGQERQPADLPIFGRLFKRGGLISGQAQSIRDVYEAMEQAYRLQGSTLHEETELERSRRLMLEDATRSISNLSFIRRVTSNREQQEKLMREALTIARDAMSKIDKPEPRAFQRKYNITKRERDAAEKQFRETVTSGE